jgi:hypothetical protein
MASLMSPVRPSRTCVSKGAAASFRYHPSEAVWPGLGAHHIMPRNGPLEVLRNLLLRNWSPFGVKVCALEPGGMRTNWGARANQDTPELLPDYEPSVGNVAKALKSYWGQEISDPAKVAQVVLRLAASDRLPAHLLIGRDAVLFAAEAENTRAAEARSGGR